MLEDESLELIKKIRGELHENAEKKVIEEIDDVIFKLEKSKSGKHRRLSASEIIILLGIIVHKLPEIAKMIKDFMDAAR